MRCILHCPTVHVVLISLPNRQGHLDKVMNLIVQCFILILALVDVTAIFIIFDQNLLIVTTIANVQLADKSRGHLGLEHRAASDWTRT